jgi:predicted alpha-1,6-mannanase (GH76 family)
VFERLFQVHKYLFEVELVDKLVLPLLEQAMQDARPRRERARVRVPVTPVLSELQSNRFLDAVALLRRRRDGAKRADGRAVHRRARLAAGHQVHAIRRRRM